MEPFRLKFVDGSYFEYDQKFIGVSFKSFMDRFDLECSLSLLERVRTVMHKRSFRHFKKHLSVHFSDLKEVKSITFNELLKQILEHYFEPRIVGAFIAQSIRNIIHRKLFYIYPPDEDDATAYYGASLSRW